MVWGFFDVVCVRVNELVGFVLFDGVCDLVGGVVECK